MKEIPDVVKQIFTGIPREIQIFQTFYNPDPQSDWDYLHVEAEAFSRETTLMLKFMMYHLNLILFMKLGNAQTGRKLSVQNSKIWS
jgi:hypothetical protein